MEFIKVEKENYNLYVFSGGYGFDYLLNAISIIKASCNKRNINKAIVDCSKVMNVSDSELERFRFAEELFKQLRSDIKLVVFSKKEDITYYGEKVARKRGVDMKVFSDLNLAIEWLLK
jgi:hypothetical protein